MEVLLVEVTEEVQTKLVNNSTAAMIAAVEIHNKPVISYRYEICTLLVINAWELLLKAFIASNYPEVTLTNDDGTSKPFPECVACVASNLGKAFITTEESINTLYEYRNKVTHFYHEELDVLLFSLLKANISLYVEFVKDKFEIDLAKEIDLVVLPIGFRSPLSPIDFLTSNSALTQSSNTVKQFINGITNSAERLQQEGIEDSILVEFNMSLLNVKRIKNADLIAGIDNSTTQDNTITIKNIITDAVLSNSPSAKEIRIKEDHLFNDVYTEKYYAVIENARQLFSDFKQNKRFNHLMAKFKEDPNLHRVRLLDPDNPNSSKKSFYSKQIYEELAKHYTKTS